MACMLLLCCVECCQDRPKCHVQATLIVWRTMDVQCGVDGGLPLWLKVLPNPCSLVCHCGM